MADIELTLGGDASGATAALRTVGDETATLHRQATSMGDAQRKQSEAFWADVAKAAAAAATTVTAFGVASVKAFMEADRIQRQLVRAAGEHAEALGRQADAMEAVLNVDAEVIKQSQTLLVQWGGVGAASDEVTRAVLDYAAATGKDAVTATQELVRNVESGGVGMAKLGVHFKATGEKGEDLKRIVVAMGKKFGGAAAADADSLHGQVEGVRIGFGNLMEDFGEFITLVAAKTGVIEKVRDAVASWREVMFGNPEEERRQEGIQIQEALLGRLQHRKVLLAELQRATDEGSTATIKQAQEFFVANEKNIASLKEQLRLRAEAGKGAPAPGVPGKTNQGMKNAPDVLAHEASSAAHDAIFRHDEEATEHHFTELEKMRFEYAKESEEGDIKEAERKVELAKKQADDADKIKKKAMKDSNERAAEEAADARRAGDAIGAAFVSALSDQLQKMSQGEEFDVAIFVGEILAATIAVAGSVIGAAYGQPALGAALGNLAAMGVRAGATYISGSEKKGRAGGGRRSYHDGGEIEHWPRFHGGGGLGPDEVPIIAQPGEHMLSRRDVVAMGGHSGVEAAKRGGGGITLNVTAIDAKSMADTFVGSGGDGLKQALRRGHGALPALLGRGPR